MTENVVVHIEIRVGSEKEPRSSDPFPFTYTAPKNMDSCVNCNQIKGFLHRVFGNESGEIPSGFNVNAIRTDNVTIKSEETSPKKIEQTIVDKNMQLSQKPILNNVQENQLEIASDLRTLLQIHTDTSVNHVATSSNVGLLYLPKVQQNGNVSMSAQTFPVNTHINIMNPQKIIIPSPINNQTRIVSLCSQNLIPSQVISNGPSSSQVSTVNALNSMLPKPVVLPVTCLEGLPAQFQSHQVVHVQACQAQPITHTHPQQQQYLSATAETQASGMVNSTPVTINVQPNNIQLLNSVHAKLNELKTLNASQNVKDEDLSQNYQKQSFQSTMDYSNENSQCSFSVITNEQPHLQAHCLTDRDNNSLLSPSLQSPTVQQTFHIQDTAQNKSFIQPFSPSVTAPVSVTLDTSYPLQDRIESLTTYLHSLKKQLAVENVDISPVQYNIYHQQNNSFVQKQQQQQQHKQTTFLENHQVSNQNQNNQHFENLQQQKRSLSSYATTTTAAAAVCYARAGVSYDSVRNT